MIGGAIGLGITAVFARAGQVATVYTFANRFCDHTK